MHLFILKVDQVKMLDDLISYIITSTDMYNVFLGRLTKCNSLASMKQELSYNEIGKKKIIN